MDAPRHRGRGLIPKPFLLVNPRSGDGEPTAKELVDRAEELGIEARLLSRGDDAAALMRRAADGGAGALGVAGGDGSLSAPATVALERELPLVCVPFGTRNHFARDLGLDCDDPLGSLEAYRGRERRVDAGLVDGRVFLNNVSLGLYASLVHDPRHKTKNWLAAGLRMLPSALGRARRPLGLSFEREGESERREALVVLVANNDYSLDALADLARRTRLDEGLLHVYVIEAVGRVRLIGLFARAFFGRLHEAHGWTQWSAAAFEVDSSRRRIHVAIDGEPAVLEPPLRFEVRPGALGVLLPPNSRDAENPAGAET